MTGGGGGTALIEAGDEVAKLLSEARADCGGGCTVDLVVGHVFRKLRHQLVAPRLQQDHQVCPQPTTPLDYCHFSRMQTCTELVGTARGPA